MARPIAVVVKSTSVVEWWKTYNICSTYKIPLDKSNFVHSVVRDVPITVHAGAVTATKNPSSARPQVIAYVVLSGMYLVPRSGRNSYRLSWRYADTNKKSECSKYLKNMTHRCTSV